MSGPYIREWRKVRSMTQAKLAELAGVSESSISQLENGSQGYSPETLDRISKAFGISIAQIFTRPNAITDKSDQDRLALMRRISALDPDLGSVVMSALQTAFRLQEERDQKKS